MNTFDNQLQSDIPMTVICKMLEISGDRWSLLIICKLYPCKKTFGELFKSVEGISSNILINRLRRLEKAGIIFKSTYYDKPVRYEYQLTDKGKSPELILEPMVAWAHEHLLH